MNECDEFVRQVGDTVTRRGLLLPGRPVGVALSGGADSVAALAALTALGYECVALHCNFHLRGSESDRDAASARSVALQLGARWLMTDMDVPARREATGESVEMACRELRYEWFARMARDHGLQAVAVAHHRDDRIETFLLNSLRATGLRGLASMRHKRGIYVRPLLDVSRRDIEDYLRRAGLGYVVDSSNLSDDYQRNRVRHHVLPALDRVEPDARQRMVSTLNHIDDARTLYEHLLGGARERYVSTGLDEVYVEDLIRQEGGGEAARLLLRELLVPLGLNASQAEDIFGAASGAGRRFGKWVLHRGRLSLCDNDCTGIAERWTPGAGGPLSVEWITPEQFRPRRDPSVMYMDAAALEQDAEWEIRPWREADRLEPFGMRGSRLVSDILSDLHYSPMQKQRVRVLTRNGVLIWVVGIRASRHYAVGPDTRQICRLSINDCVG